jgi:hypothetical protein
MLDDSGFASQRDGDVLVGVRNETKWIRDSNKAMVVWMLKRMWSSDAQSSRKRVGACDVQMVDRECRPTAWDVVPDIQARPTSMGHHQRPGWVSKHHEVVANQSNESTSEGTRWLATLYSFSVG